MAKTQFNIEALEVNIQEVMGKEYAISPLLKLKGHIAYKAASLMKMAVLQEAKALRESGNGIDGFNESMKAILDKRADARWTEMSGTGEEKESLYETACKLIGYHNELVFVLQDLADPTGMLRNKSGFKFAGVPFREKDYVDSWKGIIELHQTNEREEDFEGTYEDYCSSVEGDFRLTEEEWKEVQSGTEFQPFTEYGEEILSMITNLGFDHTCEFDELPVRAQIAAIENLRRKSDAIVKSTLKSVKYGKDTKTKSEKLAEASKMKGIIKSLDEVLCSMLERPAYKGFEEFMYGYTPEREATPLVQRFKPTPAPTPEEDLEGVI